MKEGMADSRFQIPAATAAQIALRDLNEAIADRRAKLGANLVEVLSLQTALQRRYDAANRLDAELDQFEALRVEARRVANREIRVEPMRLIRITHFEECGSEASEAAAA